MRGLLYGIGAGAAFAGSALIPLPVLALGGLLMLFSHQAPRQPKVEPPEEPILTDAELDELEIFASLIDMAPDEGARKALIEEFYPDHITV